MSKFALLHAECGHSLTPMRQQQYVRILHKRGAMGKIYLLMRMVISACNKAFFFFFLVK